MPSYALAETQVPHLAPHDLPELQFRDLPSVGRVKSPGQAECQCVCQFECECHYWKTARSVVSSGSALRWQETSFRYSLKETEACLRGQCSGALETIREWVNKTEGGNLKTIPHCF